MTRDKPNECTFADICSVTEGLLRYPEVLPAPSQAPIAQHEMWLRAQAYCALKCPQGTFRECHVADSRTGCLSEHSKQSIVACIRSGELPQFLLAEAFLRTSLAAKALFRDVGWLNGSSLTIQGHRVEYSSMKSGIRSVALPFLTVRNGLPCVEPSAVVAELFSRLVLAVDSKGPYSVHYHRTQEPCPGWKHLQESIGADAVTRALQFWQVDPAIAYSALHDAVGAKFFDAPSRDDTIIGHAIELLLLEAIALHIRHCREEAGQEGRTEAIANSFEAIGEQNAHPIWNRLRCVYIPFGEILFRFIMHEAMRPSPSWDTALELLEFCTETHGTRKRIGQWAQVCLCAWLRTELHLADSGQHGWFLPTEDAESDGGDWRHADPWWVAISRSIGATSWPQFGQGLENVLGRGVDSGSFLKLHEFLMSVLDPNRDPGALVDAFWRNPLVNPGLLCPLLAQNEGIPRAIVFLPYTPIRLPIGDLPLVTFLAGTARDSYTTILSKKSSAETKASGQAFDDAIEAALGTVHGLSLLANLTQKIIADDVLESVVRRQERIRTEIDLSHELPSVLDGIRKYAPPQELLKLNYLEVYYRILSGKLTDTWPEDLAATFTPEGLAENTFHMAYPRAKDRNWVPNNPRGDLWEDEPLWLLHKAWIEYRLDVPQWLSPDRLHGRHANATACYAAFWVYFFLITAQIHSISHAFPVGVRDEWDRADLQADRAVIALESRLSDDGWRLIVSNRGSRHIVPPDVVRASSAEIVEEHAEHLLEDCRITLRGFQFDPKCDGDGKWVAEIRGTTEEKQ